MNIEETISAINKRYGKGKICKGKDMAQKEIGRIKVHPEIDKMLGGGLPKGRIVEIFGNPSVGKSTLCYIIAGIVQKNGGKVAIIENDNGFDAESLAKFGVDTDELYATFPESAEEALDTLDAFVRTKEFDLIILDCIAMLSPAEEVEKSMEDQQMGLLARQMNKVLRKIHSGLQPENMTDGKTYNNTCIILVNQVRNKLGITWGTSLTCPGGNGREFSASIRIKVSKIEMLKNKEGEVVGVISKLETVKNKTYFPNKVCQININHMTGKLELGDTILKQLIEIGKVVKSKGWYKLDGGKNMHEDEIKAIIEAEEFKIRLKEWGIYNEC